MGWLARGLDRLSRGAGGLGSRGCFLVAGSFVASGVLWGLPTLLQPKVCWNDTAALATLRNLSGVQEAFRSNRLVDLDGDGVGEPGFLGEMTGAAGLRLDPGGVRTGPSLSPPILSPALSDISADGIATKSGYCFRVVLPSRGGGPAREGSPGKPFSSPVDPDQAERRWCAYAWPARDWGELEGQSRDHNGAFHVDAGGRLWRTWNRDRRYAGPQGGPSWDAAMPEDGWGEAWADPPAGASEFRGRDGNTWTLVR